jgi:hypothetical protein
MGAVMRPWSTPFSAWLFIIALSTHWWDERGMWISIAVAGALWLGMKLEQHRRPGK